MAFSKHSIFCGLCFCILLTAKNVFQNKLVTEEIFAAVTNQSSHFDAPSATSAVRELDLNHTIDTIRISPRQLSKPLCSREEIKTGLWKPTVLEKPPYVPSTVHLRCYPEQSYQTGEWKHTFKWVPSSSASGTCTFSDWNRNDFCKLSKRATVLIIGDSLSFENYRSLSQLLGIRVSQKSQHKSKEEQKNIVDYACKKQTRIVFRRDDLLLNVSHAIFEQKTFPQIIVMNRGAHYQNNSMLMAQMHNVVEELNEWKSYCEAFDIKCHLFWRTSVPGHPNCQTNNFTKPLNDINAMEAMINDLSNYNNRTIKYKWFEYKIQNEMVVDFLTKHPYFSQEASTNFFFEIMDAYDLNILRPDEHRVHQGDCLHNCYPGKMDVYSQLLLHFLKKQRRASDIDSLIAWQDGRRRAYNVTAQ